MHIDGQILGKHAGIVNYTVGQRRGIGVATGKALYVVYLDVENARVIVGPREMLETHKLFLRDVNWLGDESLDSFPTDGIEVAVKVRSTRPPHLARLHYQEGVFSVDLLERENAVAPGQACVLYDGNHDAARVLGGGFVSRSERAADTEVMLKRLLCNLKTKTAVSS